MKKTIEILCILSLLFAISSTAMADGTNWLFYLNATNPDGSYFGMELKMGTKSTASDGWDSTNDMHWTTLPTKSDIVMFIYDDSVGSDPNKPYTIYNVKHNIAPPESKSWTIFLWVGSNFAGDSLQLRWRGHSTMHIPDSIGGTPYTLSLRCNADPTGTNIGWSQTIPAALGSSYYCGPTFTNLNQIRYDMDSLYDLHPTQNGHAIKLTLTMNCPEPGSLLALGGGLLGLLGFIRYGSKGRNR